MSWFVTAPIWLIGLLLLAALTSAVGLGYEWQKRLQKKLDPGIDPMPAASYLLPAGLALLSLLLGFSFSTAMSRYEVRRDLVVQEANALGTTWLRVQLLDAPERARMRDVLLRYVDTRILWSEAATDSPSEDHAESLRRELWSATGAALRSGNPPLLTRGVMDSLNQSFDLASARQAARLAHIPDSVLWLLLAYAVLLMFMLGTVLGASLRPHRTQTGLLLVLLTLAHMMVLDLNRPRTGTVQVSQQPFTALRASMD